MGRETYKAQMEIEQGHSDPHTKKWYFVYKVNGKWKKFPQVMNRIDIDHLLKNCGDVLPEVTHAVGFDFVDRSVVGDYGSTLIWNDDLQRHYDLHS